MEDVENINTNNNVIMIATLSIRIMFITASSLTLPMLIMTLTINIITGKTITMNITMIVEIAL